LGHKIETGEYLVWLAAAQDHSMAAGAGGWLMARPLTWPAPAPAAAISRTFAPARTAVAWVGPPVDRNGPRLSAALGPSAPSSRTPATTASIFIEVPGLQPTMRCVTPSAALSFEDDNEIMRLRLVNSGGGVPFPHASDDGRDLY
jgi:hypothetical protein